MSPKWAWGSFPNDYVYFPPFLFLFVLQMISLFDFCLWMILLWHWTIFDSKRNKEILFCLKHKRVFHFGSLSLISIIGVNLFFPYRKFEFKLSGKFTVHGTVAQTNESKSLKFIYDDETGQFGLEHSWSIFTTPGDTLCLKSGDLGGICTPKLQAHHSSLCHHHSLLHSAAAWHQAGLCTGWQRIRRF